MSCFSTVCAEHLLSGSAYLRPSTCYEQILQEKLKVIEMHEADDGKVDQNKNELNTFDVPKHILLISI